MLKFRNGFLLFLFSVGFTKTLFLPATFVDATVLLIVGSILAYMEYKNQEKRLTEIENIIKAQQIEFQSLQDKISSIKVIQQAKPGSLTFRQ